MWKLGLIGLLAAACFALALRDASFVDEYAYITQSYQADTFFAGKVNDPYWLDFLTYDLVPLPKYLINFAFRIAGISRPGPRAAMDWYGNTNKLWGGPEVLLVARLPSVVFGALGCMAIFALGRLIRDEAAGWIAAMLLAVNPLYSLHAHRAMSEAPCEALSLLALLIGLLSWRYVLRGRVAVVGGVGMVLAGFIAGLATLAKFNGILVLLCLAAWALLGLAFPRASARRKAELVAGTALAFSAAWGIFLALNPFMTAHPTGALPKPIEDCAAMNSWQRFRFLLDHRRDVSSGQQMSYPHNALLDPLERAKVVAVQGFGRFCPLGPRKSDSTKRYDPAQDGGMLVWLPLVVAGAAVAFRAGGGELRSGEPPLNWALLAWAALAIGVVTLYLPMAWDRYQLPIQSPAVLLAAVAISRGWEAVGKRLGRGEARS